MVSNREWVDELEVVVQDPKDLKAEAAYLKATAKESYEQMAEARERLLELLYSRIHQLQYRKRTEIAVEIVRQLEAEGQFPQAHYAFDKGVLTLELTRLIESRGKHWVSEVEISRHIQWQGHWRRVDEVSAELRQQHLEFPEDKGKLSQWGGEVFLGVHQSCPAETVWTQALGDRP